MGGRFQDLGEGKIEGRKLDPRTIKIRKDFNYRDTESETVQAHIAWLKDSIKAHGVQQPVRVQYIGGEVYLVDGHCRVEACKQLFKEGFKIPYKEGGNGPALVPALVVAGDEGDILAASMIANDSLPPTKIEFGKAADRLQKLGWPDEKIALYIPPHILVKGFKATRYVKESVELHQAPQSVKKAASEGKDGVKISEAQALKIARENPLHAEEEIDKAVSQAKSKGQTTARRPKGEGKATKAKAAEKASVSKCLELADGMARVAMDLTLDRDEVIACASAYMEARGIQ